jgi:ABC-type dipeptide/oligopeptide/nickel transport system permease component
VGAYLLRRLGQSVVVLILVSIVSFALVLFSGDPVATMLPTHATEQDRLTMRRQLGLDQPLAIQYLSFVARGVQGDLGQSIKFNQPVTPLVLSKLPSTLLLAVTAIILAVAIGIPLGIYSGTRANTPLDAAGTAFSLLTVSVPSFWIGLMLILIVGDYMRLLPTAGSGTPQHLVLPAVTLAAHSVGLITRLTRASVLDELRQPYVVTARAKGLNRHTINYRHVLRNAMIPTVTVVGLQFGALLGGSVIVETVFSWPGAGWLLMQGVFARDLPLVRALVLIIGAAFILLNLLVDISYRYLDPRIRPA